MTPSGRRASPPVVAVLAVAALVSACRIERRPDVAEKRATPTALVPNPGGGGASPARDSVLAVLGAFNDALALGDVTRVAQLSSPGAVLIDQEEGVHWTREDAASALPRPLLSQRDELGWRVVDRRVDFLDDRTALVSTRYQASVSGEKVPWTAVESWVLVRTGLGWRVRYLHRSRGLEGEGRQ